MLLCLGAGLGAIDQLDRDGIVEYFRGVLCVIGVEAHAAHYRVTNTITVITME